MHNQHINSTAQREPTRIPKGFFVWYWLPCAVLQYFFAHKAADVLSIKFFGEDIITAMMIAAVLYVPAWFLTGITPWFRKTTDRRTFMLFGHATLLTLAAFIAAFAFRFYGIA